MNSVSGNSLLNKETHAASIPLHEKSKLVEESYNKGNEKTKRMGKTTIIVSAIIATVVVVAVVVPCVILIPSSASENDRPPPSFDDIMGNTYRYVSYYPQWDKSTPDLTDFVTSTENGAVVRRSIAAPTVDVEDIAPASVAENLEASYYDLSADGKFIAYRGNVTKVWRHSYTANYKIWDLEKEKEVAKNLPTDIQHLEWSPVGHDLVFVHDFTVKMINLDDELALPVNISDQGARNKDYYGIPDWMYEEEMVSSKSVLYWSPEGEKVAYLHTNEDGVELIKYTWYGSEQYPETIEIAYPKAGTTIGGATLWVYDITENKKYPLPAPQEWLDASADHYFSRFTWKDDNTCLATWTNRLQTISIAQLCLGDANGFNCSNKPANKEEVDGGWVGSFGPFYPLWKSDSYADYFTIYARPGNPDTNGYWQIAYVSADQDNLAWLTNTNYDIVELNYYDSNNKYVYYTAAYNEARRRHILRVNADPNNVVEPECMTCKLLDLYPNRCGWITPVFTEDGSWVVLNCRGNLIPLTLLVKISDTGVWDLDNAKKIADNDELSQQVAEVKWPVREFGKFQSKKYTKPYNYEIWRPEDFDSNKKYPLLIHVYAGPEFQKVTDTWTTGFSQIYMVGTRDIIVASVDGRGSAYEGYEFMRQAYLKLGQNEPVDQTDFANYLISNYDYIDKDHVAIWGWSYGGYITSHTLGYDAGNTFRCGIAVAPLADWRWYDAMYAERYMNDVSVNSNGYDNASIILGHDLKNFQNSQYTLIHGTADDNVHFQNAAEMEKALVEHEVDFDNFFYADEAHSINDGPNASKHIYHQIDIRLSHCLGKVDSPYGDPTNNRS